MLAIKPAGDNGGDEELGAVTATQICKLSDGGKGKLFAYVLGPALAIERSPGLVCLRMKFSSANFSP